MAEVYNLNAELFSNCFVSYGKLLFTLMELKDCKVKCYLSFEVFWDPIKFSLVLKFV